jgi:CheY-like chemotaxis protein
MTSRQPTVMRADVSLPPVFILDDDEDAIMLIKKLLDDAQVPNPVHAFHDGEELIVHFKRAWRAAGSVLASGLLLLDVKMPRLSGFDVLHWIRDQAWLSNLVVVMLSTSDEEKDVERARALGAHSYLLKYPKAQTLGALVRLIEPPA